MKRWIVISAAALLLLSSAAYADDSLPSPAKMDETGEETLRVSYLGPEGTYTEEAAETYFRDGDILIPETTVDDAIAELADGNADYAVIPQENTIGGAVVNYVDALLRQQDVYVAGEVILPISQTLMGIPGASIEDIQTVCSHAQGISQSRQWREENIPEAVCEEMDSTAAAASYVAQQQDRTIAAIAAPGAAQLYGLEVLAENVQITDTNRTRFYVLSTDMPDAEGKTRAAFAASCGADRIDDIMVEIHDAGLEVVTIHDRPEGSELGRYNYIIELEDDDGITAGQVSRISSLEEVRYLGSFDVIEKAG